jgi:hypothetical protein
MSKHKYIFLVVLAMLMIASLACNLSSNMPGSQAQPPAAVEPGGDEAQPQGNAQDPIAPAEEASPTQEPAPTPEPTAMPEPTRNPQPVGLRQGLASLNSYRMKVSTVTNGPTELDKSSSLYEVAYNADGDRTHVHNESVSSSADEPEEARNVSDQYQVGDKTCEISDGETNPGENKMNPLQKEMTNALTHLYDLNISVEDPVYVGEETVNGVLTEHYTFKVAGLGSESGAEVVANRGEYWVAKDGQYLVKYAVLMETRTAPAGSTQAEAVHIEVNIDLTEINQPVEITLPAECQ